MKNDIVIECNKCGNKIYPPHIKYSLLGAPYVKCQICGAKYLLRRSELKLIKE